MGTSRKEIITVVAGLYDQGGHPYYEVILEDDTHFTLSAGMPKRPKNGDTLSWVADGIDCKDVRLNGESTEHSEEAMERARKILAINDSFGEWLLTGAESDDKTTLLLKQQILAGVVTERLDVYSILRCRVPEPLIESLEPEMVAASGTGRIVMKAWRTYLRAHSIKPTEDDR